MTSKTASTFTTLAVTALASLSLWNMAQAQTSSFSLQAVRSKFFQTQNAKLPHTDAATGQTTLERLEQDEDRLVYINTLHKTTHNNMTNAQFLDYLQQHKEKINSSAHQQIMGNGFCRNHRLRKLFPGGDEFKYYYDHQLVIDILMKPSDCRKSS